MYDDGLAGPKSTAGRPGHLSTGSAAGHGQAGPVDGLGGVHRVPASRASRVAVGALLGGLLLASRPTAAAGNATSPWDWPLDGPPRVVRAFDPPALRWEAGHRGVDLLARIGAPVRSAGPGSVSFAGPIAGRGVVVVTHADGTRTTYEPVAPAVTVGERVSAGDPVGRLAAAGSHCLPAACLHWGRRRGDVYLDPMLLVRAGPARLFPVWSAAGEGHPSDPNGRHPPPAPAGEPGGRAVGGRWQQVASGAMALPVLALGATVALRRRRLTQISAGSSAASRA